MICMKCFQMFCQFWTGCLENSFAKGFVREGYYSKAEEGSHKGCRTLLRVDRRGVMKEERDEEESKGEYRRKTGRPYLSMFIASVNRLRGCNRRAWPSTTRQGERKGAQSRTITSVPTLRPHPTAQCSLDPIWLVKHTSRPLSSSRGGMKQCEVI